MTQPFGGPPGPGAPQPPLPPGQGTPPPTWGPPAAPPPAWTGGPTGPTGPVAPGGWVAPPPERRSGRRTWLIGCLVLLVILVVGVGACTFWFARSYGSALAVVAASDGRITTFNVRTDNTGTVVVFTTARGLDEADGVALACNVVRPKLAGSELANADWVIVNPSGFVIASRDTPCP